MLNPEAKLSNYQVYGQDIFAAEILARPGREIIKKFYMDNPDFIREHPGTVMRCLTYASEKGESMEGVPLHPTDPAL